MRKINITDIPPSARNSPKGKFRATVRDVSVALGREPASRDLDRRHPFDLGWVSIPPGATLCPYHAHSAQWELYVVISGTGEVRDDSGVNKVRAGDAFIFQPGEAHQLSNGGDEDFVYYVIADNPLGESCYYPDSDKWLIARETPQRKIVKGRETGYFDGEE
jgi:uncharacterized cupin superfamily protein